MTKKKQNILSRIHCTTIIFASMFASHTKLSSQSAAFWTSYQSAILGLDLLLERPPRSLSPHTKWKCRNAFQYFPFRQILLGLRSEDATAIVKTATDLPCIKLSSILLLITGFQIKFGCRKARSNQAETGKNIKTSILNTFCMSPIISLYVFSTS